MPHGPIQNDSPWPHRWALVLVCATFPLIWVGGLVTTTDAGMAVPDWPNTYGYNLFLYPWSEWFFGPWDLFIEHGHRLLGATVGMVAIGLLVVLWRQESRRWVRWFGVGLLVAVIGQGILGGMRVRLDERTLAMLHGCTAPVFFAMAVAMAVITSHRWRGQNVAAASGRKTAAGSRHHEEPMLPLAWLATICTVTAYVQLVLGAQLRHVSVTSTPSTFRLHVLTHVSLAFVLATVVVWLAVMAHRTPLGRPWISRPAKWLVVLLGIQLCLGGSTWLINYAAPVWLTAMVGQLDFAIPAGSRWQAIIVTAHVATGSLIVATSLLITLHSARLATIRQTAGTSVGASRRIGGETSGTQRGVPPSQSQNPKTPTPSPSPEDGRGGFGIDSKRAERANTPAEGAAV